MAETLRVGIVGCGGIARAHLAAYRNVGDVEIVSVYDVAEQAARSLANEAGAVVADSLEQMASDHRLDAVSICTPPGAHLDNCSPFLAVGVSILCEKPMAADVQAAMQLAESANVSDAVFMVAFCHRFHPPIIELKKLIEAGTLGEPVYFRNIFGGYANMAANHRANPTLSGGGVLIDNGSHSVDLFRFLAGEPTHVQAFIGNLLQHLAIEDFASLQLSVNGRAFGDITSSYSLKGCGNWVEWYGTRGSAIVSYWNPGFPEFSYQADGTQGRITVDCSGHPDRFTAEVAHFVECVRQGNKPLITAEDGVRCARIISAGYQSAETGRRISMGAL